MTGEPFVTEADVQNIQTEFSGYLVEQIDAFAAVCDQRDEARRERDAARGIAVELEQENAHLECERDDALLRLERAVNDHACCGSAP